MRELNIEEINDNVFKKIGKEWMLVGAKNGSKANAMTASWGGLGVMWGKNVAFVFIRQTRYTKGLVDASGKLSLSFLMKSISQCLVIWERLLEKTKIRLPMQSLIW